MRPTIVIGEPGLLSGLTSERRIFTLDADANLQDLNLGIAQALKVLSSGHDSQGSTVSVVADLRHPQAATALNSLRKAMRDAFRSCTEYLVVPSLLDESIMAAFTARDHSFASYVFRDGGRVIEGLVNVLELHESGDLASFLPIGLRGASFRIAVASNLDSGGAKRGELLEEAGRGYELGALLSSALDSTDLLIQDMRFRVEELLGASEGSRSDEVETFNEMLAPVKSLLGGLFDDEQNSHQRLWNDLLPWLSRGFEAEARLAAAFRQAHQVYAEPSLDVGPIEGLLGYLPVPICDANWKMERRGIEGDLQGLLESIPKRPDIARREALSKICLQLLRLLDSPLVRRRLLDSFLRFVWKKHGGGFLGKSDSSRHALGGELRLALQAIKGEGVFLILPKSLYSETEGRALCSKIEAFLHRPCLLVFTDTGQSWIYSETAINPLTDLGVVYRSALVSAVQERQLRASERRESEPARVVVSEVTSPESVKPPIEPCRLCGLEPESHRILNPSLDLRGYSGKKASPQLVCPQCHRLNGKAWWLCEQHGKSLLAVPIDKDRCPDCILRHHEDPIRYPLSSIGVRPGLAEPFLCPNCVEIQKERPWHEPFKVEKDLVSFYKNGVNGHDSAAFPELAAKYGLLDGYRCPGCATLLIPVHHRMLRVN